MIMIYQEEADRLVKGMERDKMPGSPAVHKALAVCLILSWRWGQGDALAGALWKDLEITHKDKLRSFLTSNLGYAPPHLDDGMWDLLEKLSLRYKVFMELRVGRELKDKEYMKLKRGMVERRPV